jgi:hypothetical protein
MTIAVIVLMIITSMGIFGFLSKAHNDQNLVSGDVQSKIAIYDEKIKTAKENIESNRKQLKQMDEAVDQVMGRSSDEKGADKANAIRNSQKRDRANLAKDIEANQKLIASLNDEAAPIRAEVRKVEAEVGPIKYIAKFIYGEHGADENMLEKAVTWIIILIVVVFDPLAVIMLLAAQMTFGWSKKQPDWIDEQVEELNDSEFVKEPTASWIDKIKESAKKLDPRKEKEPAEEPIIETSVAEPITEPVEQEIPMTTETELDKWNKMIEEAEKAVAEEPETTVEERVAKGETYIDNEGKEVALEVDLPADDSKKKTYMIKDDRGLTQIKQK